MKILKNAFCSGENLRAKCFIIGYLNLIASIIDIGCHVLIVAIVSNGFQCDVDRDILRSIDWPWLEPLLLIVNIGTHGFYPFPLILPSYNNFHVDYMPIPTQPRCYPGMLHLYLIDILNCLINVIWLQFVVSFVSAVHKKDPEPMRMFFGLSLVKLVLQAMYFFARPSFCRDLSTEAYYFISALDACVAIIFLTIINAYVVQLRNEKLQNNTDQPPPYIECLINGQPTRVDEKRDAVLVIEEKKPELPMETESQERC
ncbi:uncharacterized protein LOC125071288 [Vanessa atalanta]|uniref:uncharacterized protein LOC125071288 n=1 Tax=Vanessa atalanta TaxID=42275 RepID=UPI001FCDF107|nr:uncharacterized protein LOC125071288 [Vanessa atalanta]